MAKKNQVLDRIELASRGMEWMKKQKPTFGKEYYQYVYGAITDTGDVVDYKYRACHAGLSRTNPYKHDYERIQLDPDKEKAKVHGFFTLTPAARKPLTDGVHLEYVKWLISSRPYGKVMDPVDPEFAMNHGYTVTNLDQPMNLIGNFMIATRHPNERMLGLKKWLPMVEKGVDPAWAFVCATAREQGDSWGFFGGHCCLDTAQMSVKAVENFVLGTPGNPNQFASVGKNYTPCNAVWNAKKDGGGRYSSFLDKTYPIVARRRNHRIEYLGQYQMKP